MFTTGNNSHGCGHAVRSVYKGSRSTAADYLLHPESNLTIRTETTVDRVVLERDDSIVRAVAVIVLDANGQTSLIKTRRETIISGGAYCTPPMLLRSGIGPKEELEEIGVKCEVDSSGVGRNLMDHLVGCPQTFSERSGTPC